MATRRGNRLASCVRRIGGRQGLLPPTGLILQNLGAGNLTFDFTAAPNAVSYTLQVASDVAFATVVTTELVVGAVTGEVNELPAATYFVRVASNPVDDLNSPAARGPWGPTGSLAVT